MSVLGGRVGVEMIKMLLTALVLVSISMPTLAGGLDGKGLICRKLKDYGRFYIDPTTQKMVRKFDDYSRGYWFENGKVIEHVLGPDGMWSSTYEYDEIDRNTVILLSDHPMYRVKYLHRETLKISKERYDPYPQFAEFCSLAGSKDEIIDILNSVLAEQNTRNKI